MAGGAQGRSACPSLGWGRLSRGSVASEGFLHEMSLFCSADSLSKADQAVKKREKFLQENSFFISMSVSNQVSFFTNTLELIYPN